MALHLNLLHEEISEQRQRQRDPLKISVIVLVSFVVLMIAYYMWNAYRTLEIKGRLSTVEREWAKVEPTVTAAQKRAAELNNIIKTTKVLDEYVENRFFWGPFLQTVTVCIAPNTQLTSIEGTVLEENKGVTVSIEGVAAGREARAAAEDLRQMLTEQLGKRYGEVKVEFKALEDLDTIVNVGGASMAMARYNLSVNFNPNPNAKAAASASSPHPARAGKR
jgi:hypothetical protein